MTIDTRECRRNHGRAYQGLDNQGRIDIDAWNKAAELNTDKWTAADWEAWVACSGIYTPRFDDGHGAHGTGPFGLSERGRAIVLVLVCWFASLIALGALVYNLTGPGSYP